MQYQLYATSCYYKSHCELVFIHVDLVGLFPRGWVWHIYKQEGSAEYLWGVLHFENLKISGYCSLLLYFLGSQINAAFLSVLCFQKYF